MTESSILAFLLVFVRASGLMLTSPLFGAQNTPLPIRILTTCSLSGSLAFVIKPKLGPLPATMHDLFLAMLIEAGAGILLGSMVNLAMQSVTIAGNLADLQSGLTMSQVMNPISGVQSSVIGQLKTMLGLVIFLTADAHQIVIAAFVHSYDSMPSLEGAKIALIPLIGKTFLLGVQIAAPVMAVGFLIDAALAFVGKAVSTLQPAQLGAPIKLVAGLLTMCVGLPSLVAAVSYSVRAAVAAASQAFGGG